MTPTKRRKRTGKTRRQKARSGATPDPRFDLERHQFFLASVNLEPDAGAIHFLVSEEEGRTGPNISEIVLKCLLPSRRPVRRLGAQSSRASLRAIRPVDFLAARSAQIPCLGLSGIRFWRLQE